MKQKTVSESAREKFYNVMAADMNPRHTFYGGRLLAMIDSEAGKVASEHAEVGCVTRALDSMTFDAPVLDDETLVLRISVNRAWRTSMEIGVKVHVLRDDAEVHVASAYLTFVAVNDAGQPVPVPKLVPESDEEIRRYHQADYRRRARLT